MKLNVELNVTGGEKVLKEWKKGNLNKSDCIRRLLDNGYELKEISNEMGIIYNMVYNVSKKYIIKNDLEDSIVKEEKISVEVEIEEVYNKIKEEKGRVRKSELINAFIKRGRGESYIYSKLKFMDLKFIK